MFMAPITGGFSSALTEFVISKPIFILYKHINSSFSVSQRVLLVRSILGPFYRDKLEAVGW